MRRKNLMLGKVDLISAKKMKHMQNRKNEKPKENLDKLLEFEYSAENPPKFISSNFLKIANSTEMDKFYKILKKNDLKSKNEDFFFKLSEVLCRSIFTIDKNEDEYHFSFKFCIQNLGETTIKNEEVKIVLNMRDGVFRHENSVFNTDNMVDEFMHKVQLATAYTSINALIMKEMVDVDILECKPLQIVKPCGEYSIKNKSKKIFNVLDISWMREILIGDCLISGFWRKVYFGRNRAFSKLKFIAPHTRTSHTRRSKKEIEEGEKCV